MAGIEIKDTETGEVTEESGQTRRYTERDATSAVYHPRAEGDLSALSTHRKFGALSTHRKFGAFSTHRKFGDLGVVRGKMEAFIPGVIRGKDANGYLGDYAVQVEDLSDYSIQVDDTDDQGGDEDASFTIEGLSGIGAYADAVYWARYMGGPGVASSLNPAAVVAHAGLSTPPGNTVRNFIKQQVGTHYALPLQDARNAYRLAGQGGGGEPRTALLYPRMVLSAAGMAQLGKAGKRAELVAKLAHSRSQALQAQMNQNLRLHSKAKAPQQKAKHLANALVLTREAMQETVNAQRAFAVAGTVDAARRFHKQALATRNPAKQKQLLGQAAGLIDAAHQIAQTRVKVKLPFSLTRTGMRAVAAQGGIAIAPHAAKAARKAARLAFIRAGSPVPSRVNRTLAMPSPTLPFAKARPGVSIPVGTPGGWPVGQGEMVTTANRGMSDSLFSTQRHQVPAGIPAPGFPAQGFAQPRTGDIRLPVNLPNGPVDPRDLLKPALYVSDKAIIGVLEGLDALSTHRKFGGLGSLGDGGGVDWSGLLNGAIGALKNVIPANTLVGKALGEPQPQKSNTPAAQAAQAAQQSTNAIKPSSAMSSFWSKLPIWVIPAAGVAAVGLFFLL